MQTHPIVAAVACAQPKVEITRASQRLPTWIDEDVLARFLHQHLEPYQDTLEDIHRGIDDALGNHPAAGGFVLLAHQGEKLIGALVMLRTGMTGYVPENLLLFVAVDQRWRGRGIGAQLIRAGIDNTAGAVKLHVEWDNPAKRLYERLGFTSKYAEMRFTKAGQS